jgi:hypothetical protein
VILTPGQADNARIMREHCRFVARDLQTPLRAIGIWESYLKGIAEHRRCGLQQLRSKLERAGLSFQPGPPDEPPEKSLRLLKNGKETGRKGEHEDPTRD